jgi:hypothetical protein
VAHETGEPGLYSISGDEQDNSLISHSHSKQKSALVGQNSREMITHTNLSISSGLSVKDNQSNFANLVLEQNRFRQRPLSTINEHQKPGIFQNALNEDFSSPAKDQTILDPDEEDKDKTENSFKDFDLSNGFHLTNISDPTKSQVANPSSLHQRDELMTPGLGGDGNASSIGSLTLSVSQSMSNGIIPSFISHTQTIHTLDNLAEDKSDNKILKKRQSENSSVKSSKSKKKRKSKRTTPKS